MGKVFAARAGLRGFDCNTTVSADAARAMRALDFRFVARYVDREEPRPHHLTASEVADIHAGGLAVTPVQHVESESCWQPTSAKGTLYGCNAGLFAKAAGIGRGANVWCDLEGVDPATDPQVLIAYLSAWCRGVIASGFTPGLYVGWHAILSPVQLYALPFRHYWAAYNLNADQEPACRGCQMRQHEAKPGEDPLQLGIDTDTISGDRLGGFPLLYAPDDWA